MRPRHWLSLGCLTALLSPLPAAAQSHVSINGLVDVGIYRGFDGTAQAGTIQRSNLAIAGWEDLGGGLKATFRRAHGRPRQQAFLA